jgi:hypothetical protein
LLSTPWNSRCAICIVRSVAKPSLRLDSCVSVDVVNGGAGRSTPGFCSTDVTVHGTFARTASTSVIVAASSSSRTFWFFSSPVCASKSLPLAMRRSFSLASVATNSRPSPFSFASRSQ